MSSVSPMFVKLKKAIISVYSNINLITGTFTNIRANDYSPENIVILSPYGQGSFPVSGIKGILIPDQDSNKNAYYCTGFASNIPPGTSYFPLEGESWSFSQKYILAFKNTGLTAYRVNDNIYSATLISGEWVNKILLDIINDNNATIRNYINTVIVPAFASLSITIPPLAPNVTLTNDATAITNGLTLITDTGTLP